MGRKPKKVKNKPYSITVDATGETILQELMDRSDQGAAAVIGDALVYFFDSMESLEGEDNHQISISLLKYLGKPKGKDGKKDVFLEEP